MINSYKPPLAVHSLLPGPGQSSGAPAAAPGPAGGAAPAQASPQATADPVLCQHCGRTANNGVSCEGICVADSGY